MSAPHSQFRRTSMNINQMVDDQKDKLASSGKPLNPGAGPDLIEVLATRKLLD